MDNDEISMWKKVERVLQPLAQGIDATLTAATNGERQAFVLVVFSGKSPQFIHNATHAEIMDALADMVDTYRRGELDGTDASGKRAL